MQARNREGTGECSCNKLNKSFLRKVETER